MTCSRPERATGSRSIRSQRKDNYCPLVLQVHSWQPQGPRAEPARGLSRAESVLYIRKRVAALHGSTLGNQASLGKAEEELSPHGCTQDPAMLPWLSPFTSPAGIPPSPQLWSSLSNHIPLSLPGEPFPGSSLQTPA